MDHSYFKDRISSFHDKDLTDYDFQVVEEHLLTCQECQQLLKDFERLDSLIEKSSQLGGDDYWEKSAQKIEQAISGETDTKIVSIKKSYKGLGWKLIATAASVAVIAFIGLYEEDIQQTIADREVESRKIEQVEQPVELDLPATDELALPVTNESEKDIRQELLDSNVKEASGKTKSRTKKAATPQLAPPPPPSSPKLNEVIDNDAVDKFGVKSELNKQRLKTQIGAVAKQPEKNLDLSISIKAAEESVSATDEMVELYDVLSVEAESKKVEVKSASSSVTIRGGRSGEVETVGIDISASNFAGAISDEKAILRMLREKRDSLRMRIVRFGMVDRSAIDYSKSDDSILQPVADSSYNVMLDSMITVIIELGKLTPDSLERANQITFLRDFPWNTTHEQYQRILENIAKFLSEEEK